MSDEDFWAELKRHKKEKFDADRHTFLSKAVADDDGGWTKHTEYHWSRFVAGERLDYWPSRKKFQWRGQVLRGDVMKIVRAAPEAKTMTRDDVIRLAREAGDDVDHTLPSDLDFLERFASIVAAAEREACAAKMDAIAHRCRMEDSDCEPFVYAAFAIRSRGNQ